MRMSGIYVGQTGQSRVGAAKKGVSGLLAHEKCKTLKRNWRHPNHGNHLPYTTGSNPAKRGANEKKNGKKRNYRSRTS